MDRKALELLDARLRGIRFVPRASLETRVLLRARALRPGRTDLHPLRRLTDWLTLPGGWVR
ncbi:MAG TPA: hypothetical protein VEB59_09375 [Gemmatimonadales bacterium]|nr:hypothetical protein [Gemmatimonadales bacterium]